MSVYQRLASGDEQNLEQAEGISFKHYSTDEVEDSIIINPLAGRLELSKNSEFKSKSTEEWINIFPNAAYFSSYDDSLFGHIVTAVYENPVSDKICTVSLTKFGVTVYHDLILNQDSRFYPSIENLLPIHKESKVRKALAVTFLKNYNKLVNHPGEFEIEKRWDETNAGAMASRSSLLVDKRPNEFGLKLLQMGVIQNHTLKSLVLDTVYNNTNNDSKVIESNNRLVCLLGDQLDQLFDPLLEYSPETLETSYNVPNTSNYEKPKFIDNLKIATITDELLTVQTNFTMGLVGLLQNFIIPLRVHVLESKDAQGIVKINHIFPPTIDEVTRINCVLHDSLTRAKPFGYVEVIKVFGMILPYFYKPFIRHEANLKSFKSRFNKFYGRYEKQVFADPNINKSKFSKNYIDSVITGSLLELPKIKLILMRLYEEVSSEFSKLKNFEQEEFEEPSVLDYYYKSAVDIIDAFGGDESLAIEKDHERFNSQHRIFTPTGKLLTELATNWPPELQYGWLSRKVIGIFELKNVKPNNQNNHDDEVLIIFSDTIMFLRIVDDNYYINSNGNLNLRISDVLMHSLVNEKPLPKLSSFPRMEVSHWCSITDVIVTTYKSFSFSTSSEEDFLRFFSCTGRGFKGDNKQEMNKNYEILRDSNSGNFTTGNEVIELINKAKVLHKNQPFHLFRSNKSALHLYSTAHSATNYDNENTKSQIILLLNMPQEMIPHYFEMNQHLFLILTASYTYDGRVQLIGFNRSKRPEFDAIVPEEDFQNTLLDTLKMYMNCYFNSFSLVTEQMIKSLQLDLEYYLFSYQRLNRFEVREMMKSRVSSMNQQGNIPGPVAGFHIVGDSKLKTDIPIETVTVDATRKVRNFEKNEQKAKSKRRRSFFGKLFGRKFKAEQLQEEATVEYKELFRPTPKLEKTNEGEPQVQIQNLQLNKNVATLDDDNTDSATVHHYDVSQLEGNGDQINYDQQQFDQVEEGNNVVNVDHTQPLIIQAQSSVQPITGPITQTVDHPQFAQQVARPVYQARFENDNTSKAKYEHQENRDYEQPFPENKADIYPTQERYEEVVPGIIQPVEQKSPRKQFVVRKPNKKEVESQAQNNLQQPEIPYDQKPFRELFTSSDDTLNGLPQVESQPVKLSTELPETPKTPSETYKEKTRHNASLDVKSNFEFPSPTKSIFDEEAKENVETEERINSKGSPAHAVSASIKDVSEETVGMAGTFAYGFDYDYVDDPLEANWVQFSRESSLSSIPVQIEETKKSTKLKYPPKPSKDLSVTSINSSFTRDANFANKIRDVSAADSFRSQIVFFNSKISSKNQVEAEDSQTSSQFVDEFGKEIDMNFSSSKANNSRFGNNTTQPDTDATNSEEEYYSVDNNSVSRSPRFEVLSSLAAPVVNVDTGNMNNSFSSENTIITELLQDSKSPTLKREDTSQTLNNHLYIGNFGSMAYLSDVLNGTIDFSDV